MAAKGRKVKLGRTWAHDLDSDRTGREGRGQRASLRGRSRRGEGQAAGFIMGTVFDVSQTEPAIDGPELYRRAADAAPQAGSEANEQPARRGRAAGLPSDHRHPTRNHQCPRLRVSKLTIDRCVSAMCRDWQGGKAEALLGKHFMQLNRLAMDEQYPDRHAQWPVH